MYSTVNSTVKPHSMTSNVVRWRRPRFGMLSATTTATLARIAAISTRSKTRPAGVSVSKTTLCIANRQPSGGLPKRTWVSAGVSKTGFERSRSFTTTHPRGAAQGACEGAIGAMAWQDDGALR